LTALSCSDAGTNDSRPEQIRLDTTRLCSLVPARDPAAAAFPPKPPVKVFGTDLGWTYEANGQVQILFGDSWQRIDICPIQSSDDSLGTLQLPPSDWPGFTATTSIPDAQCPNIDFEVDQAGTAFAPIELRRWDGVPIPLGPNNTPVTGFFDGQREWAFFIVGGGQPCSAAQAASAATCPSDLSAQAADLVCDTISGGRSLCVDPGSTRRGDGAQAYYLYLGERVGPAAYTARAAFLTNKFLNLTVRTVRAFDPGSAAGRDYGTGSAAVLVWGRAGFDDLSGDGEEPPYFMVLPLPFQRSGDEVVFEPRYFKGLVDGEPTFGTSQVDAVPLYTGEFEPVNHVAISWVEPIRRWLMIYGGANVDFADPQGISGRGQPVRGAMYARIARDPWGPWSDFQPVLTEEQTAEDLVCGKQAPPGCIPRPDPLIRPRCLEAADPMGGGALYGANIIDAMTRPSTAAAGGRAADVFWNYSTWHPYSVVLARTHVEAE
jgi:hypothetical protein